MRPVQWIRIDILLWTDLGLALYMDILSVYETCPLDQERYPSMDRCGPSTLNMDIASGYETYPLDQDGYPGMDGCGPTILIMDIPSEYWIRKDILVCIDMGLAYQIWISHQGMSPVHWMRMYILSWIG